jgi:hypothetical protein
MIPANKACCGRRSAHAQARRHPSNLQTPIGTALVRVLVRLAVTDGTTAARERARSSRGRPTAWRPKRRCVSLPTAPTTTASDAAAHRAARSRPKTRDSRPRFLFGSNSSRRRLHGQAASFNLSAIVLDSRRASKVRYTVCAPGGRFTAGAPRHNTDLLHAGRMADIRHKERRQPTKVPHRLSQKGLEWHGYGCHTADVLQTPKHPWQA